MATSDLLMKMSLIGAACCWIMVGSNEGGDGRLLSGLDGVCCHLDLAVVDARQLDDESRRPPALRSRCLVSPLACFDLLQQMRH
ncbi:hypothetical protein ACLOJK_006900 [Asimina triloba]